MASLSSSDRRSGRGLSGRAVEIGVWGAFDFPLRENIDVSEEDVFSLVVGGRHPQAEYGTPKRAFENDVWVVRIGVDNWAHLPLLCSLIIGVA